MNDDFLDCLWELYQTWEIGSQQRSISGLREKISNQRDRDSTQDARIRELERQNAQLILAFFSLVHTLKSKSLLSQDELRLLLESARSDSRPPTPTPSSDGLTPDLCGEPPPAE